MPDAKQPDGATPRWLADKRNPEEPVDEKNGLAYLGEPSYYRMAYQLAVELVEGAERGFGAEPKRRLKVKRAKSKFEGSVAPRAAEIIARLIEDANLMLAWYEHREYLGKGQFWKRLNRPEKRLKAFLTDTILPCLEILRASFEADQFPNTDAAVIQLRLQMRQREARTGRLAYRPLYNLACYEATKGKPQQGVANGVEYLLDALRKAPSSRKAALLARAEEDIALKKVVDHPHFKAERRLFDPVAVGAPAKVKGKGRPVKRGDRP
jgi:hypothetical protein